MWFRIGTACSLGIPENKSNRCCMIASLLFSVGSSSELPELGESLLAVSSLVVRG
ncbi:hypothetical protein EI42_06346, partial [Thermosporothrix hazakensis]